jgi:hypothetical protein
MSFDLTVSALALMMICLTAVFAVVIANLYFTLLKVRQRYDALLTDMGGRKIGEMVIARLKDIAELDAHYKKLAEQLEHCVQKVGVVRFNAFDDTGSDLSFAIALLDEKDNGVVFSSIYGRSEARCYAKPVSDSKSTYVLSDEEKRAIDISKKI